MGRETAAERDAREAQEQTDAAVAPAAVAAAAAVDAGEGTKVRVPASVGESVTFTRGGDVVADFKVTDGVLTVRDDHERALVLANVPGAELVEG